MHKILLLLFPFILSFNQLRSQILPKEGASLNYRLIGFEFPGVPDGAYTLEIAEGNYNSPDSFGRNIVFKEDSKTNKIIAQVPAFGKQYTWRFMSKNGVWAYHHFSTAMIPNVDTGFMRLGILKNAEAYKDAYVFIDGTRVLYDMSGNPVWFLPNIEHFPNDNFEVRNLTITPQGTITFIMGEEAYEVNYNADILWKAPNDGKVSGGNAESYHHQFTRLANGHYMVLGNEEVLCKMPSAKDSDYTIIGDDKAVRDSGSIYNKISFGTVIEYDDKGNVVWSWRSSKYFKGSNIVYHKKENGKRELTPHENAFYFDEKNNVIYVSFRNISRIIKMQYPEGNVIDSYGEEFMPGGNEKGNGLFCHQHSCKISPEGNLYLFNNNLCNTGAPPTIIVMKEPANGKGALKKIWEYQCPLDKPNDMGKKIAYQFKSGGNVTELPGHSFFASMCAVFYSRVLIVSKDKQILWSAAPEKKNQATGKWEMTSTYEAAIITERTAIERLILH